MGCSVDKVLTLPGLRGPSRRPPRFGCAQRRSGVGREERVAGTAGENDDATLAEVAQGSSTDVWLRDLRHFDGGHHAAVLADTLERVL